MLKKIKANTTRHFMDQLDKIKFKNKIQVRILLKKMLETILEILIIRRLKLFIVVSIEVHSKINFFKLKIFYKTFRIN